MFDMYISVSIPTTILIIYFAIACFILYYANVTSMYDLETFGLKYILNPKPQQWQWCDLKRKIILYMSIDCYASSNILKVHKTKKLALYIQDVSRKELANNIIYFYNFLKINIIGIL